MKVRVGLSGWASDAWVGPFYPRDTPVEERLARYAQVFDCVEVNQTFHDLPDPAELARWAAATPDGFTFAIQAHRGITHETGPRSHRLKEFTALLAPLREAGKLGPILLEFGPAFDRETNRESFIILMAHLADEYDFHVELRNPSWWDDETRDELVRYKAGVAWSDRAAGTPTWDLPGPAYVRLLGEERVVRRGDPLRDGSSTIAAATAWLGGRDGFVFVHDALEGHAPATAQKVAEAVGAPKLELEAAAR